MHVQIDVQKALDLALEVHGFGGFLLSERKNLPTLAKDPLPRVLHAPELCRYLAVVFGLLCRKMA